MDSLRRLDKEAVKVRILSLLKDRPLRNADILLQVLYLLYNLDLPV